MDAYGQFSDDDLVVLLGQDDHRAFMELYHRHKTPLTINLMRILKSPDLVEEVLQELFLTLWEKRATIDPDKSVGGYLYTAALNRSKNIFRTLAHDSRLRAEILRKLMSTDAHPIDEWIEAKEARELIDQLLGLLTPQQRTVYTLCKLDGLSYREVSRKLNITETTVNSHIRNANKLIRNKLLKQGERIRDFYLGILVILFY